MTCPGLLHTRGTKSRIRQGKEKRRDVCSVSCLGFPYICDYLRTAANVMHGQKRELETQGVWKRQREKDVLSLTAWGTGSAATHVLARPSQL